MILGPSKHNCQTELQNEVYVVRAYLPDSYSGKGIQYLNNERVLATKLTSKTLTLEYCAI